MKPYHTHVQVGGIIGFNNSSITRGIIGLDTLSNLLKFAQLPNSKDAAPIISLQLTFHKSAVR